MTIYSFLNLKQICINTIFKITDSNNEIKIKIRKNIFKLINKHSLINSKLSKIVDRNNINLQLHGKH